MNLYMENVLMLALYTSLVCGGLAASGWLVEWYLGRRP